MNLSDFFNSYIGMYLTQAFCHSLIASVISDQAIRAWNVSDPAVRQRFRVIVVLVPAFSFPLYQAFNPGRSSIEFRQEALFDANRWMNVELWGISVGLVFLVFLAATSLIFIFQEMVPILIHVVETKKIEQAGVKRGPDPFIEASARTLSIDVPDIVVIDEEQLIIYSTTGRTPAIFVSQGLVSALTPDQLQAALAHELGHIARSRRPVLLLVFVFRVIMFFNPISLVEFRRAVRNEEKICDDIAVSLTNQPEALSGALEHFFPDRPAPDADIGKKELFAAAPIEEYSHIIQLENRIARLAEAGRQKIGGRTLLFVFTFVIIAAINYFIV